VAVAELLPGEVGELVVAELVREVLRVRLEDDLVILLEGLQRGGLLLNRRVRLGVGPLPLVKLVVERERQ